jgi:hypothetical protein
MPDINSLKKWIKINDLNENDTVSIVDEGIIKEFDFSDKRNNETKRIKALELGVSINGGERKGLTLNNISLKMISDHYGSNTAKWVGASCIVKVSKTMSFGKLTDIKYLEPMPQDVQAWDEGVK